MKNNFDGKILSNFKKNFFSWFFLSLLRVFCCLPLINSLRFLNFWIFRNSFFIWSSAFSYFNYFSWSNIFISFFLLVKPLCLKIFFLKFLDIFLFWKILLSANISFFSFLWGLIQAEKIDFSLIAEIKFVWMKKILAIKSFSLFFWKILKSLGPLHWSLKLKRRFRDSLLIFLSWLSSLVSKEDRDFFSIVMFSTGLLNEKKPKKFHSKGFSH